MSDFKRSIRDVFLEEFAAPQDAFLEIESELRRTARGQGIDYDNALVINSNRSIRSPKDIKDWSSKHKQWAGYGSSWLDWIAHHKPQWLATHFYVITVDTASMVSVNNKKATLDFEKQYITRPTAEKDLSINYQKLYDEGKCGVAFRPYNEAWNKNTWYDSIDMDSAVIANSQKIRSVKFLLDASEIIADFKDRQDDGF
jgi:hypothetical protein